MTTAAGRDENQEPPFDVWLDRLMRPDGKHFDLARWRRIVWMADKLKKGNGDDQDQT